VLLGVGLELGGRRLFQRQRARDGLLGEQLLAHLVVQLCGRLAVLREVLGEVEARRLRVVGERVGGALDVGLRHR